MDRLAEAHFVGQQATEVIVVQVPEPRHAHLLVEAEHLGQLGTNRRGLEFRQVANRVGALGPSLGRSEGGLEFFGDRIGTREVGEANLQV